MDLLSGQSTRATGVKYRCTILEGRKGSCVEEVVDYVPGERFATAFPEDTWGISEMLRGFVSIPSSCRTGMPRRMSSSRRTTNPSGGR